MTFPIIINNIPFDNEEEMLDYLKYQAEGETEKKIKKAIRELNGWEN